MSESEVGLVYRRGGFEVKVVPMEGIPRGRFCLVRVVELLHVDDKAYPFYLTLGVDSVFKAYRGSIFFG